jgi:hypothetical protein
VLDENFHSTLLGEKYPGEREIGLRH